MACWRAGGRRGGLGGGCVILSLYVSATASLRGFTGQLGLLCAVQSACFQFMHRLNANVVFLAFAWSE
jgi:hypothetical protein